MLEWPIAVTLLTALIGATVAIITINYRFLRDAKEDLREMAAGLIGRRLMYKELTAR